CALTRVTQTVCGEKNKSSLNYRKRALGSQGRAMAAATSSATMTWHDCCRLVCLELAMANPKKKVPQNVAGKVFVDTTCINCDACRQLAPATFADSGDYSFVYAQPRTADEERAAVRALLACPTGSIGTVHSNNATEVKADFPLLLEDNVYYC